MTFDIKTSSSEVFPEVKILKPEPWFDYRGEMWTFWQSSYNIPEEKISDFSGLKFISFIY